MAEPPHTAWLSSSVRAFGEAGSSLSGDRGKLEAIWNRYGEVIDDADGAMFLFSVDPGAADTQPFYKSEAYLNETLWILRPAWIADHLDHADHFDARFAAAIGQVGHYILAPQANDEENSENTDEAAAGTEQKAAVPGSPAAMNKRSASHASSSSSAASPSGAPESNYTHVFDLKADLCRVTPTLQVPISVDFSQPPYSIMARPSKKSKAR